MFFYKKVKKVKKSLKMLKKRQNLRLERLTYVYSKILANNKCSPHQGENSTGSETATGLPSRETNQTTQQRTRFQILTQAPYVVMESYKSV